MRLAPVPIDCELVGVLIAGQQAEALGRTPGGDWIQIVYAGVPGNVAWVYAPLVQIINLGAGALPIVEPPATPTPACHRHDRPDAGGAVQPERWAPDPAAHLHPVRPGGAADVSQRGQARARGRIPSDPGDRWSDGRRGDGAGSCPCWRGR